MGAAQVGVFQQRGRRGGRGRLGQSLAVQIVLQDRADGLQAGRPQGQGAAAGGLHGNGLAGVVDKELLAGLVLLAHDQVTAGQPGAPVIAETAVLVTNTVRSLSVFCTA